MIIAEKAKAAKAIAAALGPVTEEKRGTIKVFHVPSRDITVIPLRGHIANHQTVAKFASWQNSDPRDIIIDPDSLMRVQLPGVHGYVNALQYYGRRATTCVIGTDADVEGCTIGLIDALPFVFQVNPNISVLQLWVNSLQSKEVQRAYAQLSQPKYAWAEAGDARAIIDAIIGFSATREVTIALKTLLRNLKVKVASIGRVQTCLLYLIYLREKEIRGFTSVPYWVLSASINLQGQLISINHEKNPFKDENVATAIHNKIKSATSAILEVMNAQTVENRPPTPLNTTKALVLLTRQLGIPASLALKTMEELYLDQLISYPRTESDIYPKDYDHTPTLQKLATHSQYGKYAKQILATGQPNPTRGKKDAGDHIPISPVDSAEPADHRLNTDVKKRAYDLLTRHYLASFMPPAKEQKVDLTFDIQGERFLSNTLASLTRGYLEVLPEFLPKYITLPPLTQGAPYPVRGVKKDEKKTSPPPRYTDTTLVQLMERKKIGTKSTRPTMIQILLDRQYIQRIKKQVCTTDFGYELMANLEGIWVEFLEPDFTRRVEEKLDLVMETQMAGDAVIDEVKGDFLKLFDTFRVSKSQIVQALAGVQPGNSSLKGKTGAKREQYSKQNCPSCGNALMKVVKTNKNTRFLACCDENCKFTLALPKTGRVTFLKAQCCACGFSPVKITKS
ncbi:MAG TPA: DNA topoisomerase, partial [Candidatus Lokiarchaeia archaeon]|nr:DNA topoisomerase [Candidatus Lokiarchaeia archaeon]